MQNLCHIARLDVGAVKLCLRIEGNQLVTDPTPVHLEDTEYPIKPAPSISLAEILRMQTLTTRDRLVIAYILAKSVWQYYNTDWLNALWTTDNIHFMMEEREYDHPEESTLNPARPYLAFADVEPAKTPVSETVNCYAIHRYPRILALGAILVELFRKEPRHSRRDNSTLDAFLNNSLLDNSRTMNKDSWPHLDLDTTFKEHFRATVAVCFEWKRLERTSSQDHDAAHAFRARRDLLWDEVVSRLQRLCRVLKLIDQDGAVIHGSSHILDRVALYETSFQNQRIIPATPIPVLSSLVVLGSSSGNYEPADAWLGRVQSSGLVGNLLRSISTSSHSRPIRIAILDSGYDVSNEFFTYARNRRIVAWHDFLKDLNSLVDDVNPAEDSPRDSDGHGTDVLSMALRVAPFAEFCVARVFERSNDVASRSDEIAKVSA